MKMLALSFLVLGAASATAGVCEPKFSIFVSDVKRIAKQRNVSIADAVQCRGRFVERVEGWTTNNWVFVPTILYGGNRFRVIKEKYPPVIAQAD